jgi:hypothetical protein
MRDQGKGCKGTGLYESRLAFFHGQSGKMDKAAKVLNEGFGEASTCIGYGGYVLLAKITLMQRRFACARKLPYGTPARPEVRCRAPCGSHCWT